MCRQLRENILRSGIDECRQILFYNVIDMSSTLFQFLILSTVLESHACRVSAMTNPLLG